MKIETLEKANNIVCEIEHIDRLFNALSKNNPSVIYYHEGHGYEDSGYHLSMREKIPPYFVTEIKKMCLEEKERLEKELEEL